VGQLVAALVSPASSPVLAVGNAVINYSPEPLTSSRKTHFGTNDKPILLSGMAVVITAVAAAGGLRRVGSPDRGVTVVVLGLAGLLAVVAADGVLTPGRDRSAGLAGRGSGGVSGGCTGSPPRSTGRCPRPAGPGRSHRRGPESPGGEGRLSRRNVLLGSSAAIRCRVARLRCRWPAARSTAAVPRANAVTAALAKATLTERAPAIPAGASFARVRHAGVHHRQSGTSTGSTSPLRIPTQTASDWRLRIHGLVERETTLTFADLMSRRLLNAPSR